MIVRKMVMILVIIAIVLASLSITYRLASSEKSVSTSGNAVGNFEDTGQGGVGITIISPSAEDKNAEE